jgi:hypothetical protein
VSAAASAKALATGWAWRLTGRVAAGQRLVGAVNHGGEDEQTIAAMFLVKAGDRAVPLIREGFAVDAPSPTLVDILGSIGTDTARQELQRVSASGEPSLAEAARQMLLTLDEIDHHQG